MEKKGCGCGCNDDFKREVKNLEKTAKKPTQKQHGKKKQELYDAFKGDKKK